jgi:hypothetical protein
MNVFFHEIELQHIIVHRVGNKSKKDGLFLSPHGLELDNSIKSLLLNYFLDSFKEVIPFYRFSTNEGETNRMLEIAKDLFKKPNSFYQQSCRLCEFQHEVAVHPKIKSGEVYITYFKSVNLEGETVDAIGVFKSENKETYLKVYESLDHSLEVERQEGVNIKKLDKGCMIYNTAQDDGYRVQVIDNTSPKSDVARFWKKDFLNIEQIEDEFYHTQNYIELCQDFCDEVFTVKNDVSKSDQLLLLNRSLDYFCEEKEFEEEEFQKKVIQDEGVIEAFKEHQISFEEKKELKLEPSFQVHKESAIQTRKKFRSIIKLDKNFHIYIHGDQSSIERGFDDGLQKSFYKLYFNNEN